MNKRIRQIVEDCGFYVAFDARAVTDKEIEFLAQQVAKDCAKTCMELAAKCAGLPYEGALAVDCANLIKEDYDL